MRKVLSFSLKCGMPGDGVARVVDSPVLVGESLILPARTPDGHAVDVVVRDYAWVVCSRGQENGAAIGSATALDTTRGSADIAGDGESVSDDACQDGPKPLAQILEPVDGPKRRGRKRKTYGS